MTEIKHEFNLVERNKSCMATEKLKLSSTFKLAEEQARLSPIKLSHFSPMKCREMRGLDTSSLKMIRHRSKYKKEISSKRVLAKENEFNKLRGLFTTSDIRGFMVNPTEDSSGSDKTLSNDVFPKFPKEIEPNRVKYPPEKPE